MNRSTIDSLYFEVDDFLVPNEQGKATQGKSQFISSDMMIDCEYHPRNAWGLDEEYEAEIAKREVINAKIASNSKIQEMELCKQSVPKDVDLPQMMPEQNQPQQLVFEQFIISIPESLQSTKQDQTTNKSLCRNKLKDHYNNQLNTGKTRRQRTSQFNTGSKPFRPNRKPTCHPDTVGDYSDSEIGFSDNLNSFSEQWCPEDFDSNDFGRLHQVAYELETRLDKVRRYLTKKIRRKWGKKILYGCRKDIAVRRVRVQGRFVSRQMSQQIQHAHSTKPEQEIQRVQSLGN